MSEYLRIRGALEEKKLKAQELAVRAAGVIRALRDLAVPASITPLREIDSAQILELSRMLHEIRGRYMDIISDMEMIKKDLGI